MFVFSCADSCPVLSLGSWSKSSNSGPSGGPVVPKPATASTNNSAGEQTSRTGWAMKLWRRGSSQERPLRPPSAYSSENSYTEEPSVHPDAESPVYAELAQGLNSDSAALSTYSEIPDPARIVRHKLIVSDYGYGNCAYALSEAPSELAESSSNPSSAYYSDVSTDARTSKKKRKKKKGNEREAVVEVDYNTPANISSVVPIISARLRDNILPLSSESLCSAPSPHDVLPLSLRFWPRSYTLERQGVGNACTPCHSCTPISTLPIIRHPCELPTMALTRINNHNFVSRMVPHEAIVKFAVRTTSTGEARCHGHHSSGVASCSPGHLHSQLHHSHSYEPRRCSNQGGLEHSQPCPPSEYV